MGVKRWNHPPGTLRALLTVFGQQFVICRPCERYTPMRVAARDLDRLYDPCPFRCSLCRRRAEIVDAAPDGYHLAGSAPPPSAGRPAF